MTEEHQSTVLELKQRHAREVKELSEKHADEKIAFQTELESLTERMMNSASPDGQTTHLMERAQEQLQQIRDDQQAKLTQEQQKLAAVQAELEDLKAEHQQKQEQITELQA